MDVSSDVAIERGAPPGAVRARDRDHALVALIGNPNTGKTTLFNRLTGARARVGNYPGVTVERRTGTRKLPGGATVDIVDLPGSYSLSARSAEEMIALGAVLGLSGTEEPDLAVVVIDAGQLVRNFYLVIQLIELQIPLIVAVNMIRRSSRSCSWPRGCRAWLREPRRPPRRRPPSSRR